MSNVWDDIPVTYEGKHYRTKYRNTRYMKLKNNIFCKVEMELIPDV